MQEMQKINVLAKEDPPADQLDPSIHHPWRNHVGLSY